MVGNQCWFFIYDGYQVFNAGGSWQKVSWAAESNFIGIGKVTKGLKVINKGSSKSLKLDLQYFSNGKRVFNVKNKKVKFGRDLAT